MATSFFKDLYTADQDIVPEPLVNLFPTLVPDEINMALCKDFSEKEISDAMFQIGPLKSPGADGFPARFFQRASASG